jgi:hypothetical protein
MVTSFVGTEKYKLYWVSIIVNFMFQWLIDCKHNYRQTMGQHGLYVTQQFLFILFFFISNIDFHQRSSNAHY